MGDRRGTCAETTSGLARIAASIFVIGTAVAGSLTPEANSTQAIDYLNTRPGVEYVGDEPCRECHQARYETFKRTGMGRSMSRPRADGLGAFSKPVTLQSGKGGAVYSVYGRNGKLFHRVEQLDSAHKPVFTETHEVAYTVGSGDHGQSYFIDRDGFLFLSPLSFYSSTKKWDLSPGYESGLYRGFTRPAGELCVSCHSGLSRPIPGTINQLGTPAFQILSIGCERCHGPGALHIADRRAAKALDGPTDRTIVNPRDLSARLRDDVCYQCHLAGEARVQRPGKRIMDFRPGTPLDDNVAVFLVPASLKVGGFQALGQPEQIQMSRCRQPDGVRLDCITCHDPHLQQSGAGVMKYFDAKCIKCHAPETGRFALAHGSRKPPVAGCITCHMPKKTLANIAHTSLTDHRIPRLPDGARTPLAQPGIDSATNLIWPARPPGRAPDLRTLALAFAQLAPNYPGYGERGFPVLERAAQEFTNDADIQAAYGQVLLEVSPDYRARARQVLERAISAGSKSVAARRRLAQLLLEEGDARWQGLLTEVIRLEPYNAENHLQLARSYVVTGNSREAFKALQQVISFDPGNPEARKMLRELPP